MHKVLLVESETELGAQVTCLLCPTIFHVDWEMVERYYTYFHHNSGRGVEHDQDVLILDKIL